MSGRFAHGYALLVGIGESAYSPWSLPTTVRDVQAIRSILADPALCAYPDNAEHIRLLHDVGATRQAIQDGLAWLADQAKADAEATAVIYYAGHGWLDRGTGNYYLIAHDVRPFDVTGSSLLMQELGDALYRIPARRLLVMFDCCHAQAMRTAEEGPHMNLPAGLVPTAVPKELLEDLKRGEGRTVFTSCHSGQNSWIRPDRTMSIYTYHLIEALQGASNLPGDFLVHVSNLISHLGRAVPESARQLCGVEQTPFFDATTEDFAVATLRGGKGLPSSGYQAVQAEAKTVIEKRCQATVQGPGAAAQGADAQAAGERAVVGRDIIGPVVTGNNSTAVAGRGGATISERNIAITDNLESRITIVSEGPQTASASQSFPEIDTEGYHLSAIRDLLLNAFTAPDLRRFFLYADDSRLIPALQEFGEGDGLAAMVDKAIEYCRTRALLPNLLREVEHTNPQQYCRFTDQLHANKE